MLDLVGPTFEASMGILQLALLKLLVYNITVKRFTLPCKDFGIAVSWQSGLVCSVEAYGIAMHWHSSLLCPAEAFAVAVSWQSDFICFVEAYGIATWLGRLPLALLKLLL